MRVFTSKEGYVFTLAKEDISLDDRFFANTLYLGINDDISNYIEIPEEEAQQLIEEQLKLHN